MSLTTATMQENSGQPGQPEAPDEAAVPLPQGKVMFAFSVLYILFMLDFAARLGINAVFPVMQKDLGLSDAQMGLMGSAVLVGMTAFVLPLSFLADRGSKKKAVAIMAAIWGVGSVCTGLLSNFLVLLCGRFLVGVGNASYAPVSVSMLTSWFRRSRWGSVVGTYNSAMSMGLALGTALTGLLAGTYGWRMPFLILGGLFSEFWGVKNALLLLQIFLLPEVLVMALASCFYLKDYARANPYCRNSP